MGGDVSAGGKPAGIKRGLAELQVPGTREAVEPLYDLAFGLQALGCFRGQ